MPDPKPSDFLDDEARHQTSDQAKVRCLVQINQIQQSLDEMEWCLGLLQGAGKKLDEDGYHTLSAGLLNIYGAIGLIKNEKLRALLLSMYDPVHRQIEELRPGPGEGC